MLNEMSKCFPVIGYQYEISDLRISARPSPSGRTIGRELWDNCRVAGRNETGVLRRFNNAIGVLNRMLAEEYGVSP